MFKKRILNNKKQVKIGINEETEEDKLWITLFIFVLYKILTDSKIIDLFVIVVYKIFFYLLHKDIS